MYLLTPLARRVYAWNHGYAHSNHDSLPIGGGGLFRDETQQKAPATAQNTFGDGSRRFEKAPIRKPHEETVANADDAKELAAVLAEPISASSPQNY